MRSRSKFVLSVAVATLAVLSTTLGISMPSGSAATTPTPVTDQVFNASGNGSATATVTTSDGELALAFVAGDGGETPQSTTVSGGGLSWNLVGRANGRHGTSEVWSAGVVAAQSGSAVSAQLAYTNGNMDVHISVVTYKDAVGVVGFGMSSALSGEQWAMVNAPAGSLVYGVGNDWDTAAARTPGAGQTLDAQDLDHNGDTYWVQHVMAPTTSAGNVMVKDTAPTADQWNLAAVAVVGTGSPPLTTTTTSGHSTTTPSITTTSTTPSTTTTSTTPSTTTTSTTPSTTTTSSTRSTTTTSTTTRSTTTTSTTTPSTTVPATTSTTTTSGGEIVTNVPHPAGFPDATNTGYLPTGVTLHSCATTLNVANDTYDSCLFRGDVQVVANNVHITRSKVLGGRISTGYGSQEIGLSVSDTEIDGTNSNTQGAISAMGDSDYTCLRCNVHNTNNGFAMDGSNVTVQDSWVHDLHSFGNDHMEAIYSGGGGPYTIIHNNLECHEDVPNAGGGCSSAASWYSNNNEIVNLTVRGNLFNTTGSDCTYYGSSPNGGYKEAGNVWVTNNYYGRYFNTKCGQYNASIDWQPNGTSTWSGNVFWPDLAVVIDGGYL